MKARSLLIALALLAHGMAFAQPPADNFGFRAAPAWGGVSVLTVLWQFSDTEPFPPDYRTRYTELLFGGSATPIKPSLGGRFGFFDQISNGNVNFLNAGVVGPVAARDLPGTPANESTLAGSPTNPNEFASMVLSGTQRSGFDFRPFDKNRDGVIGRDELCINIINSDRRSHEFFATTEWPPLSGPPGATIFNEIGYTYTRLLGYVYSPSLPTIPAGTQRLNFWFKPDTGDNYTTTRATGVPAGYSTDRAFGHVFSASRARPANTVGIFTWYNPVRRDYLLTTTSRSSPEAPALRSKGYSPVRAEGFIFDPALPQPRDTVALYLWEGNGLIGGGQKSWIDVGLSGGLRIQTDSISIAQDGVHNLSVIGHEMIHYVGGVDVYGAGFGKNYQYSLMAALQGGVRLSHPDPMNKIIAGWTEPIVKTIGTRETFEILATENPKNSKGKTYVFYDPARGKREFFVLEYRYRHQLNGRSDLIPLYNLWDSGRGDNRASTSFSSSGGVLFDPRPISARFHKVEGFIFNPSHRQPAGTVPLYEWYSNTYGDGFTTTNPAWAGRLGDRKAPDYVGYGVLGYVYDPARPRPANTLPLYSWFSPSRNDNYLTADLGWAGTPGVSTIGPDYTCVRLEGYIPQGAYFNYDGAAFNNLNGIPDSGLAIWYVKIGDNGLPLIIEARDPNGNPLPGEIDMAVYILPPSRSYGFSQNLFKNSDGTIDVPWPDGRASGLRLEVLTTDLTDPILRVRTR